MKHRKQLVFVLISFLFLFSCEEYKTHVINTIYPDGSVSRMVIMKKDDAGAFDPGKFQVPLDSTWSIDHSLVISDKQDTTWILSGEKLFENVAELNAAYEADTGANRSMTRIALFEKKFRWFNTLYRFSERVESILDVNCSISDYMTDDEFRHFSLPGSVQENLKTGVDSLIYQELADSIESKYEQWILTSLVKQWGINLNGLLKDQRGYEGFVKDYQTIEADLLQYLRTTDDDDSLSEFFSDSILTVLLGADFVGSYSFEIDSAMDMLDPVLDRYMDAEEYEIEIRMPGTVISSNGYLATDNTLENTLGILWSVTGDYFLTEDYTMWVESKVNNNYAWIISVIFLAFTLIGLIRYRRKES